MDCPKGHGPMNLVEERTMYKQYLCADKSCNVRVKFNTETGEAVQIATGIAALATIFIGGS